MKFKDKDGNVFEDIDVVRSKFCKHQKACEDCAFFLTLERSSCRDYCERNPAESARMMGYEVVEDEADEKCAACINEYPSVECVNCGSKPWNYKPKEANMGKKKPRICEVLGIEDMEPFRFANVGFDIRVNGEKGTLEGRDSDIGVGEGWSQIRNPMTIYAIIFHPDRIIRQPRTEEKEEPMKQDKPLDQWTLGEAKEECKKRKLCANCVFRDGILCKIQVQTPKEWDLTAQPSFTEEEAADARAIVRLFFKLFDSVTRNKDGILYLHHSGLNLNETIRLQIDLFPSIRPGNSYTLSQIAGVLDEPGSETGICGR